MTAPEISVLMPVYNAAPTLKAAVWSVINQSYQNFEFLIYLDGCDDASEDIIKAISDDRIRMIKGIENKGIVHARNVLVKAAKGRFIAWLDADDIALPGRLAYQYDFMEVHPEISVLGSWVEVRNSRIVQKVKWPADPGILKAWSFYRNPLAQSSLMIRNSGDLEYDKNFEYLEDYRMLQTLLQKGNIALYPEFLCSYYEDSEKQRIDKYLKYDFVGKLEQIMREHFAELALHPGKNELSLIREFLRSNKKIKFRDARQLYEFFVNAMKKNDRKKRYEPAKFNAVTAYQMLRLARVNGKIRWKVIAFMVFRPWLLWGSLSARVRYGD